MKTNITKTNAIRVWAGFKLPSLSGPDFYRTLGDTFIPGTLYMLRPLGINAYNVSVLVHNENNLPHECALIVYQSRNAYRAITRENLHGRVHRASHYAVFDMQRSRASFPELLEVAPPQTDTLYLFNKDVDWQQGYIHFSLLTTDSLTAAELLQQLPSVAQTLQSHLGEAGYSQAILLAREQFITLWAYRQTDDLSTEALSNQLTSPLLAHNLKIHTILPANTFPSFTPYPELMYVNTSQAVQFKYKVEETSFIY